MGWGGWDIRHLLALLLVFLLPLTAHPQAPQAQARRFTTARTLPDGASPARTMAAARAANATLATTRSALISVQPTLAPLAAAWSPAGPSAIQSLHFGAISGRITSLALSPDDPTGNDLFVGTSGGGLWHSTNAAAPISQVTFTPLTDTLPAFAATAGASATSLPSLSIGAVLALPGGIVLAGTGDPNDADDSFYGSGILRSADSGLTWALIQGSRDGVNGNHSFFGLGFAAFAASSANPSLIVAALSQSAQGALVNAPSATNSVMGLYYSIDSGVTWRMSILRDGAITVQSPLPTGGNQGGNAATAVVWNPLRQRFFAAIRYHGFYQSADGITWTRLPIQPGLGLTPAACPPGTSTACPILRGALAVQPLTGDTFALSVDRANHDQGLFRDVCAATGAACAGPIPTFAQQLPSTPLETAPAKVIPQADYNLTLAALPVITPSPDTLLFVGASDLFRCSLANGCALRNTTNATNGCAAPALVAPAQHALALGGPPAGPLLFLGNDGGLWRSLDTVNQQGTPCSPDDSAHFTNLNLALGSLAEVVSLAQHPSDPAILLAGLGASGTVSTTRADQTAWQQLSSGEGGNVAIDPSNPNLWYLSTGPGVSIATCTNGAACTPPDLDPAIGSTQVSGDLALLDAPWLLDPAAPATLLAGTCRVWRGPAAGGSLWSPSNALSPLLSGPQNPACATTNGFLRSLAVGGVPDSNGSPIVYAGLTGFLSGGGNLGGHLFANTLPNAATPLASWTDLAASPVTNDFAVNAGKFNPGRFPVSSLTADPHDATGRTVYATIQGFSGNGLSVPHLYRSTDAGAHWTNISANLPPAPANAVVVDPNDANTLYVALDTGVYATTQVTTCTTADCWSLFGASLPNSPVTALAAAPALPTGDGRLGLIRAGTYGRGLWQIPLLSASTLQQPAITLGPPALAFSTQAVGTRSAAATILVTNTGNAPLLISRIAITSSNAPTGVIAVVTDFVETDTCMSGGPIAPGAACALSVTFAPSGLGARASTLTLFANVPGGQAAAALSGTAAPAAAITLAPSALAFPATPLSASSRAQFVSITNTGGAPLTLSSITLSAGADFVLSGNSCGPTLAPDSACAVSIVFRPASLGARSATLTVVDSLGTHTAALSGTSISPATDALSSSSLLFPAAQVGTSTTALTLILTNAGDTSLALVAVSLPGQDFTAASACGTSLAAHAACAITVTFTPHTVGLTSATLTVADEFRSQTVTLSGTAFAPPGISLLPAGTLAFPATGLGGNSVAQRLTLTNNGGLPLLLSSVTLSGDFVLAVSGTTCGVALAPTQACTLSVLFAPTAPGQRSGSIAILSNAADLGAPGPRAVLLSGTGVDFTLASSGPTSLTIASGKPATFALLLSSPANTPGVVTFTCTGLPANSACVFSPTTLPLGNPKATLLTVTLATGVPIPQNTASLPTNTAISTEAKRLGETSVFRPCSSFFHSEPQRGTCFVTTNAMAKTITAATLATLLPFFLRRRRLPTLLLALIAVTLTGCGGTPRQIPGTGTSGNSSTSIVTPTPPGAYTVTVTATSAGLGRSVDLRVTVQ